MKEAEVSTAVKGYFNILWQLGKGRLTRTNSFKGMLLSYYDYQRLLACLNGAGARSEALAIAHRAHSVSTGEEGWPDWSGVITRASDGVGVFCGVEVKGGGGKLREGQLKMQEHIRGLGGIMIEAKSVDDAAKEISEITGHPYFRREDASKEYTQLPF